MSAPTWQDFYDFGMYTLQSRRPKLVGREGDITDAMTAGCATMADAIIGYAAGRFRSTYLDGAEGADLTEEARDRGVERNAGSRSVGIVTFGRPAIGASGTIPAGFRVATAPGPDGSFATFVTDAAAVFSASDLQKSVSAKCSEIGRIGNVLSSSIVRRLDTPFDSSIDVVVNLVIGAPPPRFVGGSDAQNDPDLRDQTRSFYLTQRRGTADALIFGAKQVPGVARVSLAVDPVTTQISLYVADADGNSNSTMIAAVALELENWRAVGDVVNVIGATIFYQPIQIEVTARAGVAGGLTDRIRAAIVSRIALLSSGNTLYRDAIAAAGRDVDRENILSISVIVPATNIVPDADEIIRTTTDLVSIA